MTPPRLAPLPAILAVLLVVACGGGGGSAAPAPGGGTPPAPPAAPGLATTSCGSFQGNAQGTTYAYLGIRYAPAPSGSRRWQAPQPAPCATTVQQASTFGAKCPQLDRDTGAFVGSARSSNACAAT